MAAPRSTAALAFTSSPQLLRQVAVLLFPLPLLAEPSAAEVLELFPVRPLWKQKVGSWRRSPGRLALPPTRPSPCSMPPGRRRGIISRSRGLALVAQQTVPCGCIRDRMRRSGSLSHRTRAPLHYDRSPRALTSERYELFETTSVMLGGEMLLDEGMVIAMRDFPHYFGEVSSLTISACPLRRA